MVKKRKYVFFAYCLDIDSTAYRTWKLMAIEAPLVVKLRVCLLCAHQALAENYARFS